jgi:sulfatase-like protein
VADTTGGRTLRALASCLWPIDGPTALAAALAAVLPGVALWFHAPPAWVAATVLIVVAIEHAGAAIKPVPLRLAVVGLAIGAVYVGNALLGASYFIQHAGFNDIFFANLNINILPAIPIFRTEVALIVADTVVGLTVALWAARRTAPRRFSWAMGAVTLAAVLLFAPVHQVIAYRVTRLQEARTTYDLARVLAPVQPSSSPGASEPAPSNPTNVPPPKETRPSPRPDAAARLRSTQAPRTAASKPPASGPGPEAGSGARATDQPDAGRPPEPPLRNLVLIYLEGLEQAFFEVPGLMPRLAALRTGMVRFSNVRSVVGSTIGGIVSTQCGWPPFTDQELYAAKTFYPGLRCLGDEMKRQGYHSVFMEGFTLNFTRLDTFFGTHGFAEVLGRDQLLPMTPDPNYRNDTWGVEDDALFALARPKFETLAREAAPFTLALITIDTHVPGFVSRSCSPYGASENRMLQAVHCTDQVVGDFIEFVHASPVANRTVIALVSDHLLWGGIADHGLQVPDDDRRLTVLLEIPETAPREVSTKGTEFDVGPTIAEALGVKLENPGRIGLGSSLFAGDGFLWTEASGLSGKYAAIQAFARSDTVRDFVKAAREPAPENE